MLLLTKLVAAIVAIIAPSSTTVPSPPLHLSAFRMRSRAGTPAVARGTAVRSSDLFTDRVFANAADGFGLASLGAVQYPVRSVDGGRTWRIDGPEVHRDAADGAEAVGFVGVVGPRTYFAYGSSVVDVTTDGGRTWWEAFLGDLVVAVVPDDCDNGLVAFVQDSSTVTWRYVSRDGGRHWTYQS